MNADRGGDILPPPRRFAGGRVIGSLKVSDDPTEHQHKYVILTTSDATAFNCHVVAFNGVEWVSGQGHYDLPWQRAVAEFAARAIELGNPVPILVRDPLLDLLDETDRNRKPSRGGRDETSQS